MHKIGAVGDFEHMAYFSAIGVEVHFPKSGDDAEAVMRHMAKNAFAIIFIDEFYEKEAMKLAEEFKDMNLPAIVPLGKKSVLEKYTSRIIGSELA